MRTVLFGLMVAAAGLTLAASSAACDQAEPANSPADVIRVEGTERLQWDQAGPSLDAVKSYRYVAVVGRRPSDLKAVTCAANPAGDGFVCTSELPPMTSGVHQVWVLAVATDDTRVLVSRWAAPLIIQKQ